MEKRLTKKQAARFILMKQGLLGPYQYTGKDGVVEFIKQAGCIQYDPIDVCGKNAELVLQSRVRVFNKKMLYELLYEERRLLDYWDKQMSIIRIEDWGHFAPVRKIHREQGRSYEAVNQEVKMILAEIDKRGPLCSGDLNLDKPTDWYWSETKLSRAALETLYFRGELIIHHKEGTRKYYAKACDYIPAELFGQDVFHGDEMEFIKWEVARRIGSIGLLWNRGTDALLNIPGLKTEKRQQAFKELAEEGKIICVQVEQSKYPFYCLVGDLPVLDSVDKAGIRKRTEFIAPLDNVLWDRNLIEFLFGFEYRWEIYTPKEKRRYGYYVLPILHGDKFVGRVEVINNRKKRILEVKEVWWEKDIRKTKQLELGMEKCINRFSRFHDCLDVVYK